MGSTQTSTVHSSLLFLILLAALSSQQVYCFSSSDFPILDEFLSNQKLFQEWKQKHGKVHSTKNEEEMRLENFGRNVKYIVEKKSKRKSESKHLVGLTNFGDRSNEEFRKVDTLVPIFNKRKNIHMKSVERKASQIPSRDWRKRGAVTEVKDRGGRVLELRNKVALHIYATATGVICLTIVYQHKVVTIERYQEENALLCAVARRPVTVGIVGSTWDFQLYTGGVYDGDCSSNLDDIDHVVVIVGYGSVGDIDYWIINNSWGVEGYAYIRRNTSLPYGVCAINSLASYPKKESSSSPPPPYSPSTLTECGDYFYCETGQTCCCELELYGVCFIQGCCPYANGVCCDESEYCCPSDYSICDVNQGMCLKENIYGDYLGVPAMKRRKAKYKFSWSTSSEKATREMVKPL